MHKIASISVLALLVSGCNPAYQRPTSPDVARIRFMTVNETGYAHSLSAYAHSSENCGTPKKIFGLGGGPFNVGGGKKSEADIGMPKDPYITYAPGQYYETRIEGGRRFFFSLAGRQRAGTCFLSGSFEPVAGADYDVIYSADQLNCSLNVSRITVNNGRVGGTPVPTARQRAHACTFFWN